jgi:hypothetical protein
LMRARAGSLLVVLAALGAFTPGCRMERWGKGADVGTGSGTATEAPEATFAKRVGDADATAREGRSASFDLDERTARPRPTLVLRLDYFPAPRPGSTNLPACLPPLTGDVEVGLAACETKAAGASADAATTVPVFAKNLDQDCYTDMRRARVPAKEPLQIKDCRRAYVAVAGFDPKLRVDIEVK